MTEVGKPRTSLLAIGSMILGIMTVTFGPLTGIPGIVLGVFALVQIGRGKGTFQGKQYAVAGLVLCVVIIPLRIDLANSYQKRLTPVCLSNMKQVTLAILQYTTDYDDKYPPKSKWCDVILAKPLSREYSLQAGAYRCPCARDQRCGYAYNDKMATSFVWDSSDSKTTLMLFDAKGDWNTVGSESIAARRHQDGMNVAFADGHTDWTTQLPPLAAGTSR